MYSNYKISKIGIKITQTSKLITFTNNFQLMSNKIRSVVDGSSSLEVLRKILVDILLNLKEISYIVIHMLNF